MKPSTVGELLHWSYANLAMAHAAVDGKATKYGRLHFMIRARLYAGLNRGSMNVGALADDDRLKMLLPQACCYCGSRELLAADHLIPKKRGGPNSGDNLVWACRSCNSSKGARDVLAWMAGRGEFPPLLLLRRYLKLAIELSRSASQLTAPLETVGELPFELSAVPTRFPLPGTLRLWVTDLA
jgi:hypothetical protein